MPRKRAHSTRAIVFCLVAGLIHAGCASVRKGPTPEERASFGTIGVARAAYPPSFEYAVPAKGRPDGAAKGAAVMFFGVFVGGMQGGAGAGSGPGAGMYLLVLTALATAAAPIGAVVGAVKAMPGKEAASSEKLAKEILGRMRTQEALRGEVLEEGSVKTRRCFLPVDGAGPASADNDAAYGSLAGSGIDTVLEVAMQRIALEAKQWGSDPPLKLTMKARCRLVRVADGKVIDDHAYTSMSVYRKLSAWAADNAAVLEEEYERGYRKLAADVIHRLFLSGVTPEPARAALLPLPAASPRID